MFADLPFDLRLFRADNPSPFTGAGTNSYILGRGEVLVIDPGPDLNSHLAALLGALGPGEKIGHILITHAHLDHTGLVPRLVAVTGARVWAFGRAEAGRSAVMQRLAAEGLSGGEGADLAFAPDETLADGEQITLAGLTVTALHLPGHMGCHLGFACGDVLFSGDHVMDWSTSLVSPPDGDMTAYLASLRRLQGQEWRCFLPGHGGAVPNPARRLADLLAHRLQREAAILAALNSQGPATPAMLTAQVYQDTPVHLHPAAERNLLAHLIDLAERGLVQACEGPLSRAVFHVTET